MIRATPDFRSPLLSPEFTQIVANIRHDVRVAVYRRKGQTIGFLPHHRRAGGMARPVGAPFSDYTAFISFPDPDIAIAEALRLAHIDRFQVIGLIDPYGVFGDIGGQTDHACGIDLTQPLDHIPHKHVKNINRLRRRLEEQHGEVAFITPDRNPDHFELMLRLKREQARTTGLHDFLAPKWVDTLMRQLFAATVEGLHGQMLTLSVGGKGIIFHYGVRLGDVMHPWISSFDPAYSAFSPGQVFLAGCADVLKADGVDYYDLSTGEQHYKTAFGNTHRTVTHGHVYGDSMAGRCAAHTSAWTREITQSLSPRMAEITVRLNRRLDQICALELDTPARLRGIWRAALATPQRLKLPEPRG
ncbi:GNAT family N-acetyltransferase [Asticcacaulis machinosus]|uniref:GNAT family N-acetyltransferase n=1 Tax=Asticcacaulis machinosus TaxID=2984211 RepID=A0ABT5HIL8_9CAUL|nr:GNAT family N-acetyltransferase [Asticcacaulis machinosus]MDC7676053.1 GNAT family N-acetyltransferase [Asticcacaulis machinosus]